MLYLDQREACDGIEMLYRSSITSIKMPSAYEPAIIRLWHVTAYPAR